MHAGLLPHGLTDAAVFFDPGLAPAASEPGEGPYFRPSGLPLAPAELAAVLLQYEALEREVRTPRELDAFFSSRFEDAFPETAHGIEDALRDRMRPGPSAAERAAAAKAQVGLCLAWRLEEKVLELSGLGGGVEKSLQDFAANLGLTDDDADELPPGLLDGTGLTDKDTLAGEFRGPWRPILDAMLRFLPAGTALALTDPQIVDTLVDAGVVNRETPSPQADALVPDSFRGRFAAATLPGWRLLLDTRPRPGTPWLDAPRTVLVAVFTEE